MIIIEQLAAKLQVQLAAEGGQPLPDMLGLQLQLFVVIVAQDCHRHTPRFKNLPNHCNPAARK